jgi:hypothetical protein
MGDKEGRKGGIISMALDRNDETGGTEGRRDGGRKWLFRNRWGS